jgi:hypothetical protein
VLRGQRAAAAAVVAGARRRQPGDLAPQAVDQGHVVRNPDVRATRLVDVDLGAADVERGDLLALGALDERGAGDHHVGLLGHVDPVGDDRHVAAAGDAVAEHPGELGHAVSRQQAVHLEDVAGAAGAREALGLLGQKQPRAVDQVHRRQAQGERDLLGPLDLLRRARPPRARGHGVVVGDDHAPPALDQAEGGDDASGRRALIAGEDLAVVDEGPDLARRGAGIEEQRHPLAGGQLALGVDPLDVLGPPAALDLGAARAQAVFEDRQGGAVIVGGGRQRAADGDQRDQRHDRPGIVRVS